MFVLFTFPLTAQVLHALFRFWAMQPRHLNEEEQIEEQRRVCALTRPAQTDRFLLLKERHLTLVSGLISTGKV